MIGPRRRTARATPSRSPGSSVRAGRAVFVGVRASSAPRKAAHPLRCCRTFEPDQPARPDPGDHRMGQQTARRGVGGVREAGTQLVPGEPGTVAGRALDPAGARRPKGTPAGSCNPDTGSAGAVRPGSVAGASCRGERRPGGGAGRRTAAGQACREPRRRPRLRHRPPAAAARRAATVRRGRGPTVRRGTGRPAPPVRPGPLCHPGLRGRPAPLCHPGLRGRPGRPGRRVPQVPASAGHGAPPRRRRPGPGDVVCAGGAWSAGPC